jgi:hypothetical protein
MKLDGIPGSKGSPDANQVTHESSRQIEFKSQCSPSVEVPVSERVAFARTWQPGELIGQTIPKACCLHLDQIHAQLNGTDSELVALRQIDSCAEQTHPRCHQIAPIVRSSRCGRMLIRYGRSRGPLAKHGIKWLSPCQRC